MAQNDASPQEGGDAARKKSHPWVWILLLVLLAAAVITALNPGAVKGHLLSVLQWTERLAQEHRLLSMGVIVASYIVACVLLLPGSLLTLGAGFILKTFWGTVTVSVGSTLGACAAFLVGRTIARHWVEKKVGANPRFAAIDGAVGREGLKIVLLTRLSPVFPFNLLNYGFGLTKVKFWQYALASWVGMLPGTVMYVYLGSALGSLADAAAGKVEGGAAQRGFFWIGLLIAVVVAVFVARVARRALRESIAANAHEGGQSPGDGEHE